MQRIRLERHESKFLDWFLRRRRIGGIQVIAVKANSGKFCIVSSLHALTCEATGGWLDLDSQAFIFRRDSAGLRVRFFRTERDFLTAFDTSDAIIEPGVDGAPGTVFANTMKGTGKVFAEKLAWELEVSGKRDGEEGEGGKRND